MNSCSTKRQRQNLSIDCEVYSFNKEEDCCDANCKLNPGRFVLSNGILTKRLTDDGLTEVNHPGNNDIDNFKNTNDNSYSHASFFMFFILNSMYCFGINSKNNYTCLLKQRRELSCKRWSHSK